MKSTTLKVQFFIRKTPINTPAAADCKTFVHWRVGGILKTTPRMKIESEIISQPYSGEYTERIKEALTLEYICSSLNNRVNKIIYLTVITHTR